MTGITTEVPNPEYIIARNLRMGGWRNFGLKVMAIQVVLRTDTITQYRTCRVRS